MSSPDNTASSMPDVANHAQPGLIGKLDWVGMNHMQMPVLLADGDGKPWQVSALVDAHVNLIRTDVRGIHMSRLYLRTEQALGNELLAPAMLRKLLRDLCTSQGSIADRARLRIRFDHLVRRPSLKSGNAGWRSYPITIEASLLGDDYQVELSTDVLYSSTCPASAALARQLIQRQFADDFDADAPLDRDAILAWLGSERGMIATPHAQRSVAKLRVKLKPTAFNFSPIALVDRVEQAVGTPVQTAVKREDEQAFAHANGNNLLFCEDAARRIQRALDADDTLLDFAVRVSHEESLHPHDAVAWASKGVPGGYDGRTVG